MSNIDYVGSELELFAGAKNWKRYWASQVAPFIGEEIMDVGAGLGANVELLHRQGAHWLCVEPDADLAKGTASKLEELGLTGSCAVLHGTLADVDATRKFDTILYIDVLEHIEDDQEELRRAAAHLRPGGHVIVLAPAYQWLFTAFDTAVGHFRRYTKATLELAAPKELQLKQLRYLDSVGFFASAANKMILKSANPKPSQIAFWDRILVPPSRLVDKLLAYKAGKTVVGVWQLRDS